MWCICTQRIYYLASSLFWTAFQFLSLFILFLSYSHYNFLSISIWLILCVLRNTAFAFYIYIVVHISIHSFLFPYAFCHLFAQPLFNAYVNVDDCRYYYPLSVHCFFIGRPKFCRSVNL